jgi:hypothetical protein
MGAFTRFLRKLPLLRQYARLYDDAERIALETERLRALEAERFARELLAAPRAQEPARLLRHERQVYSQNGEDGAIAEILRRIGAANRTCVEFGVDDGVVCNTAFLLAQGWRGWWLEASRANVAAIRRRFGALLASKQLVLREAFVNAENVTALFRELGVPAEPDVLSIDIDTNDYWVWKALEGFRPRVVVIEYNAIFPPDVTWVRAYDPRATWDGTSYQGASLKSLELLGAAKGYALVGCTLSGVNAYFVRSDLAGSHFHPEATAGNHYEPPRFYLVRRTGHPGGFGPFEIV